MLEALRNATKTWPVKLLFGLLVLSFLIWGVGDMVTGIGRGGPAIEVGETEISPEQVNAEFKREVDRLQPLFGGKLTTEDARKLGLLERTIETLVTRTLIDEAGRRLGLAATDEAVVAQVAEEPAFRNELGQFDRDRLRAALNRAGLSEAEFLRIEKNNLIRTQMAEALSAGVAAPEALVYPLARLREERRIAETVLVKDEAIAPPAAPDAAALEQYYKDNAARFMAPEYRAVTALLLRPADVTGIEVTDAMVAEAYQQRMDEFHTPETREISQLVLPDDEAAAKAGDLVKAGKSLSAIAEATGQEIVELGAIERRDLPDDLAQAVFAQKANSVGQPVKTALGWHVVKVGEVTPERTRPLEEVKAKLAADLRREQAMDRLADLANQVEDALGGGATLEEAAQRFNLKLVKIDAIDAQGLDRAGKPVADLPEADSFLDVTFNTDQMTESQLTEANGAGYFLVRVDQITAPEPRPLAEVKESVLAAWQAEKRHELAGQRAENMAEQMRRGDSTQRAAQAFGLKASTSEPFAREGAEAVQVPSAVASDLFNAEIGAVSVGAVPGGWVVARLAKVVPFDPAANGEIAEDIRRKVSTAVAGDLVDQYIAALNAKLGVTVDRSKLVRPE